MRIIIDIGHPAHVHFFKNLIWELEKKGHVVKITAVGKKDVFELLDAYNFEYVNMGSYNSKFKKILSLLLVNLKMLKVAIKFKPDLLIGWGSPFICHTSYLLNSKSILFLDNEPAMAHKICTPFADIICTSSAYSIDYGKKHLRYNSYEPLAYLHPDYFNSNDNELNKLTNTDMNEYILLRFSAWDAIHDLGENGFNFKNNEDLHTYIYNLERYCQVFISNEGKISDEFKKYELNIPADKYHNFLSHAKLYIGEGASSAVEAALLGVPSIFVSSVNLGFINELENEFGAIKTTRGHQNALNEAIKILENKNSKDEMISKKRQIIESKDNLTNWMINLIENQ